MAISVIPFNMPEPIEIPVHIVAALRQLPRDEAVAKAMNLLMEVDVAETLLYERVDADGILQLGEVVSASSARAHELKRLLGQDEVYGNPLCGDGPSLAGKAFADKTSLLVMGKAEAGEEIPLSPGLSRFLLPGDGTGNIGFIYVLTFISRNGQPLGALTLMRPLAAGPLNHEQPNITERVRLELSLILEG